VDIFSEPLVVGGIGSTEVQRFRRKITSIVESMCSGEEGANKKSHSPAKSSISIGDGVMMLGARPKSTRKINMSRSSSIGMSIGTKLDELDDDELADLDSLVGGGGSVLRSHTPTTKVLSSPSQSSESSYHKDDML